VRTSVADYIIAKPEPRRQACFGMRREPEESQGGIPSENVDLIRLLAPGRDLSIGGSPALLD
jgi:hypothetical protein